MSDVDDLTSRGQKSVEVASTYIQVLIGLGSGIIAAVLGFIPNILTIDTFNFLYLKFSLIGFGVSIVSGLFGLGALVSETTKLKCQAPPNARRVRIPVMCQFIAFAAGIILMLYVIP
jgi:hypothetical protein